MLDFGWQALSVLILSATLLLGLGQTPSAVASEKLTPENVSQVLVPQLFRLHLSQHEFTPDFTKRMLKEYLNQLDGAHRFYLKSEADAITEKSDEDLKKLADQSLAGDFSTWRGILDSFLKVQVARDATVYAGLEGRKDEIRKEAEKRTGAPKTVADVPKKDVEKKRTIRTKLEQNQEV